MTLERSLSLSTGKSKKFCRRTLDIILSGVAILGLSPLLIAVAFAAAAVDGRPVFFHQTRIGRNGRRFLLHKFRTMSAHDGAERGLFEAGNTSRVMPFGRFLRKTKLDELPQLWNVLRGEMSIVGPRPEVPKWVAAYPDRWARVLAVTPGITDPASIHYRNEEELLNVADDPESLYRDVILPHKLDIYETYVRTRTGWKDLGLIISTIRALVLPRTPSRDLKTGASNSPKARGNRQSVPCDHEIKI